jgi:CRP/FNR family transcriptional regulator, cyclic AMP receptor protein
MHDTGLTLRRVEWRLLGGVPDDDIRHVLSIARRRTFKRGEVVFHESDPADSLHLIVKGHFAMHRTTRVGDQALLAVRGPGDAFGEVALVSPGARSATASALEPAETLCVRRDEFDRLRDAHPSVDRMLVSLLSHEIRRMSELLTEAYYEKAEKRVLRRLLDLAVVYGNPGRETEIPLTQEQLASLAGASRATVNAVLAAERERGTIALRRGFIILHDLDALMRSAGTSRRP